MPPSAAVDGSMEAGDDEDGSCGGFVEVFMGKPWEFHGKNMEKNMEKTWENHGIFMEKMGKTWDKHGKYMGKTWKIHEKHMGNTWKTWGFDASLGFTGKQPKEVYGWES